MSKLSIYKPNLLILFIIYLECANERWKKGRALVDINFLILYIRDWIQTFC